MRLMPCGLAGVVDGEGIDDGKEFGNLGTAPGRRATKASPGTERSPRPTSRWASNAIPGRDTIRETVFPTPLRYRDVNPVVRI